MTDLFTPFDLLGLKNRVVMAPMTRCACDANGSPTIELGDYYIRRAKNSVGLIIIESAAINSTHAMGYLNGVQFHNMSHVEAWKPIVEEIKSSGAKAWIQIFHAGRLTVSEIAKTRPIAPSAIKTFDGPSYWRPEINGEILNFQTKTPYSLPKEASKKELEIIIDEFANSCSLAEKAGFNGVELHGAHGYLLHQLVHGETNQRTDEYNNESLYFIDKLVKACRNAVSDTFTLCYRLSIHMVDSSYVRYDEHILNYRNLIQLLDKNGIDVFHSSELKAGGTIFGGDIALCELIRKYTNKPIIICGRIYKQKTADRLLTSGKGNLIAFGRSLISNPLLIKDFENGIDRPFIKFDYAQHMDLIV